MMNYEADVAALAGKGGMSTITPPDEAPPSVGEYRAGNENDDER